MQLMNNYYKSLLIFFILCPIILLGQGFVITGADVNGEASNDHFGYSVSLDADGDQVAIGAIYNDGGGGNSGHARVYTYDATAPAAVAGLTAISYNGGASLSWTANSESDIAKYYIYSSTDNSTYTKHSTEP